MDSNEQVAPEKVWLQSQRTSEGYYVTGASTDLGVVEYIRLDLHTAALAKQGSPPADTVENSK